MTIYILLYILDFENKIEKLIPRLMMTLAAKKISYPYITSNPEIANGAPIISGTRITVRTIAGYYQMGMSVDEILVTLSHLSPAQVHSALTYYFDQKSEIDADLIDSANEKKWGKKVKKHPKQSM